MNNRRKRPVQVNAPARRPVYSSYIEDVIVIKKAAFIKLC